MGWVVHATPRHAPAASHPEKTRYPLYRRFDAPQGRSGRVRKISPPLEFDPPDRSARSESLYRLSYASPRLHIYIYIYNYIYIYADNITVLYDPWRNLIASSPHKHQRIYSQIS